MPPSPQEIKARLDKVVDQEGNVLDMASVLDIVAVLEKITITKEALEATRIGRVINLMRKKTNNDDLAKRAKRLVKKWQKLVSNHFKNLAKAIELSGNGDNGKSTPTPQINGVLKEQEERPKSCSEIPPKKGLKRRRTSISAEGSPLNEKDDANDSKKSNDGISLTEENISTNDMSGCESVINSQNGLHNSIGIGVNIDRSSPNDSMITDNNRLKNENSSPGHSSVENSDDWITVSLKTESGQLCNSLAVAVEPPSDIPEEDLSVIRKQLPEDCIDPVVEADGVNGCYNKDGAWCSWSENVAQSSHGVSILPYVILE